MIAMLIRKKKSAFFTESKYDFHSVTLYEKRKISKKVRTKS
jgi:hypothetical protein